MDQDGREGTAPDPLDGDPRLAGAFGAGWPQVRRFHDLLVTHGDERGLIGPRELGRLWERHLLNSAAAAGPLSGRSSVVDLGSGAGLPGVVLAAMLPTCEVMLLEPMERRVVWLNEVVADLGLANATVLRCRAQDAAGRVRVDAVVTRAVAAMAKLYVWAAPLLSDGGTLVALKGGRAAEEVEAGRTAARRSGFEPAQLRVVEPLAGLTTTTLVVAQRGGSGRG